MASAGLFRWRHQRVKALDRLSYALHCPENGGRGVRPALTGCSATTHRKFPCHPPPRPAYPGPDPASTSYGYLPVPRMPVPGKLADPHVSFLCTKGCFACRQRRMHHTGPRLYLPSDNRRRHTSGVSSHPPKDPSQPPTSIRGEPLTTDTMAKQANDGATEGSSNCAEKKLVNRQLSG